METDYSLLTAADFETVVRNYALFLLTSDDAADDQAEDELAEAA